MITFALKVVPNARKPRFMQEGGWYKLYVNSPPVDGKANAAVIEFFSDSLGIPKRMVSIIRGETSRQKTIAVDVDAVRWAAFLADDCKS